MTIATLRKHLIGVPCLQLQRFTPLPSWQGVWSHAGEQGAGEVADPAASPSQVLGLQNCGILPGKTFG